MASRRIIVLGSAAGGGFPQWNCACPVCALAWAGDPRVKKRTQSSLALEGQDGAFILVNASPDARQQIMTTRALHPRGALRDSPISDVVLTNADVDHVMGLLHLRERQKLTVHAARATLSALRANALFRVLSPDCVDFREIELGRPFKVNGVPIVAFAAPGKVPLYLEGEDAAFVPPAIARDGSAVALAFSLGEKRVVHAPCVAEIDETLLSELEGCDVLLFDGTVFHDDEMARAGVGAKTGRRMGHVPMEGEGGSLQRLAGLKARRIYVHVNNTNPALIEGSPERLRVEAAGWEVAEDGMEIAP
jgi:pyrroloquinoline quinone biosynthesis protein B